MGLKEIVLARFRKQRGASIARESIQGSLATLEKTGYVLQLVEQTILPRKLVFTSELSALTMIVCEGRLFSARYITKGAVEFDLSPKVSSTAPDILDGLSKVFETDETFTISIVEVDAPSDISSGLILTPDAEAKENGQSLTDAAPNLQSAPGVLLTELEADTRSNLLWLQSPADAQKHPGPLPGLDALYTRFAPALGQELLFVVTAKGNHNDTYAFAMDGREGAALELDPQKMGKCIRAWQNLVSAP